MPTYRRTLDELVALYALEPSLRDVYVEGPSDAEFISWFLRRRGLNSTVVYEIDTVAIGDSILDSYTLANGQRSRVIALARFTLEQLGGTAAQVTCLVDRDFDDVQGTVLDLPNLVYTDYVALELYAFSEKTFDKLLSVFVGGSRYTSVQLISQVAPILRELFAFRAASVLIGLNLRWLPFESSCDYREGEVTFDAADFELRYLLKSGQKRNEAEFRKAVAEVRTILSADNRRCIHGHDLVELLAWLLPKTKRGLRGVTPETIRGALLSSIDPSELDSAEAFTKLIERLAS